MSDIFTTYDAHLGEMSPDAATNQQARGWEFANDKIKEAARKITVIILNDRSGKTRLSLTELEHQVEQIIRSMYR